jgi:hypothetical protein
MKPEMTINYVPGGQARLIVTPSADATFAGWQTAEGIALEGFTYVQPGETVLAVFNQP